MATDVGARCRGIPACLLAKWLCGVLGCQGHKTTLFKETIGVRALPPKAARSQNTCFLNNCGWLALVPQASNNTLGQTTSCPRRCSAPPEITPITFAYSEQFSPNFGGGRSALLTLASLADSVGFFNSASIAAPPTAGRDVGAGVPGRTPSCTDETWRPDPAHLHTPDGSRSGCFAKCFVGGLLQPRELHGSGPSSI